MTVSRQPVLGVGDEIRIGGQVHVVDGLTDGHVRLLDVAGSAVVMPLARLLTDPTFAVISVPSPAPLPPAGLLDGVPEELVEQARWWERHIVEVLTGLPPGAEKSALGRPEFDPETRSLRQRELAKVAELAGAGEQVSFKTLQRLRRGYEREGFWALVDHRSARLSSPTGRADDRVVAAMLTAIAEQTHQSTGTATRVRRRTEQILTGQHGQDAPPMPPERTFYGCSRRCRPASTPLGPPGPGSRWPSGRTDPSGRSARSGRASGRRSTPPRGTSGWCWTTVRPTVSS